MCVILRLEQALHYFFVVHPSRLPASPLVTSCRIYKRLGFGGLCNQAWVIKLLQYTVSSTNNPSITSRCGGSTELPLSQASLPVAPHIPRHSRLEPLHSKLDRREPFLRALHRRWVSLGMPSALSWTPMFWGEAWVLKLCIVVSELSWLGFTMPNCHSLALDYRKWVWYFVLGA
jgi:hypothetical protein